MSEVRITAQDIARATSERDKHTCMTLAKLATLFMCETRVESPIAECRAFCIAKAVSVLENVQDEISERGL